jgi:electron transfer flavoprotein alpha subunit
VANLAVMIELIDGRPRPGSLEVLGQARRVATELGATLYATAAVAEAPKDEALIDLLSKAGADKVMLLVDPAVAQGGIDWATHGPTLAQVNERLAPLLFGFAATQGAKEVAPRIAARAGASYLAGASFEVASGRLAVWEGAGPTARRLEDELDFPVVVTVREGRYRPARGDDEAEVELVSQGEPCSRFQEIGWEVDDAADETVLRCPRGAEPAAERLARILGARVEPAPTASILLSVGGALTVSLGDPAAADGADLAVAGPPIALADALADRLSQKEDP